MEMIKLRIDQNGRLSIPAILRQKLHIDIGQEVLMYQEGEELKIRSFKDSAKRARDLIKHYNTENVDLLALLLQQRREEGQNDV